MILAVFGLVIWIRTMIDMSALLWPVMATRSGMPA